MSTWRDIRINLPTYLPPAKYKSRDTWHWHCQYTVQAIGINWFWYPSTYQLASRHQTDNNLNSNQLENIIHCGTLYQHTKHLWLQIVIKMAHFKQGQRVNYKPVGGMITKLRRAIFTHNTWRSNFLIRTKFEDQQKHWCGSQCLHFKVYFDRPHCRGIGSRTVLRGTSDAEADVRIWPSILLGSMLMAWHRSRMRTHIRDRLWRKRTFWGPLNDFEDCDSWLYWAIIMKLKYII